MAETFTAPWKVWSHFGRSGIETSDGRSFEIILANPRGKEPTAASVEDTQAVAERIAATANGAHATVEIKIDALDSESVLEFLRRPEKTQLLLEAIHGGPRLLK